MPIANLHAVDAADFSTRLRALMVQLEGNNPLPYFDSAGLISIGIGFNIHGRKKQGQVHFSEARALKEVLVFACIDSLRNE